MVGNCAVDDAVDNQASVGWPRLALVAINGRNGRYCHGAVSQRCRDALQEKPQWWKKRKSSIVKAHMLLLAHLGRADIPESLVADHRSVSKPLGRTY